MILTVWAAMLFIAVTVRLMVLILLPEVLTVSLYPLVTLHLLNLCYPNVVLLILVTVIIRIMVILLIHSVRK